MAPLLADLDPEDWEDAAYDVQSDTHNALPRPVAHTLDLTPHPVGLTNPSVPFRREDLYGDDGR